MSSLITVGHIEQRPVDQLKPHRQNARTHSEAQVEQIIASIREFGFVSPILIGADNGIIAGHARLQAARKLGMSEVPVIVLVLEASGRDDGSQPIPNASWAQVQFAVTVPTIRDRVLQTAAKLLRRILMPHSDAETFIYQAGL